MSSWAVTPFMRDFYADPFYDMFGGGGGGWDMDFPMMSSGFSRLPSYMMSRAMEPFRSQDFPVSTRVPEFMDRGMTRMINDKNQFAVNVDVHQFRPEELSVKTTGDYVTIEGNHEEREDPHGYIKRHFVRKYMIPEDVKAENISSSLSSDGVLTIKAPKERKQAIEGGEKGKEIPIERSAFPAIATAAGRGQRRGQEQQQQPPPQQQKKQGGQEPEKME